MLLYIETVRLYVLLYIVQYCGCIYLYTCSVSIGCMCHSIRDFALYFNSAFLNLFQSTYPLVSEWNFTYSFLTGNFISMCNHLKTTRPLLCPSDLSDKWNIFNISPDGVHIFKIICIYLFIIIQSNEFRNIMTNWNKCTLWRKNRTQIKKII
jgi:hypothetical protein